MNCLLWEDQFYEDGVAIAERIKTLVPQVEPARVAALAIEGREQMKLRHAPLLVLREMARHEKHRLLVTDTDPFTASRTCSASRPLTDTDPFTASRTSPGIATWCNNRLSRVFRFSRGHHHAEGTWHCVTGGETGGQ